MNERMKRDREIDDRPSIVSRRPPVRQFDSPVLGSASCWARRARKRALENKSQLITGFIVKELCTAESAEQCWTMFTEYKEPTLQWHVIRPRRWNAADDCRSRGSRRSRRYFDLKPNSPNCQFEIRIPAAISKNCTIQNFWISLLQKLPFWKSS